MSGPTPDAPKPTSDRERICEALYALAELRTWVREGRPASALDLQIKWIESRLNPFFGMERVTADELRFWQGEKHEEHAR